MTNSHSAIFAGSNAFKQKVFPNYLGSHFLPTKITQFCEKITKSEYSQTRLFIAKIPGDLATK